MNTTLSTDHFKTFDACKHQYYLKYIKKIKLPFLTNEQIKKGKIIHSLMQYKLNGLEIKHIEKDLDNDFKSIWEQFKNNPILKYENILNEWEFNIALDKTWITGRIDAVFKNNQNYIIADWKTSLKSLDKDINYQNMIYSLAFYEIKKEELNLQPENIKFVFVSPDKDIEFDFDTSKYTEYKNFLKDKIEEINSHSYDKNFKSCKFCKHEKLCKISSL